MRGTHNANMAIHCCYLLVRTRFQKLARDYLLYSQHDTIFTSDTDSCSSILDRLGCIFHL